ncbi:hypothetical protein ACFOUP_06515 [Belliella kenyensis]|uniref:Bacteriocin-type signal sequence-containing protein n=1 Tax=Belliella kenyensis TaxID=1472724 RepID=A0ABV8EIV9_9BACT|nr:hypothetical protein [Belliella kenyensis]MCH7401284.1 hypothetical protein [Belliella kenyensis]MDN3602729.1 hypothetical protein [Belliella kenyensis]
MENSNNYLLETLTFEEIKTISGGGVREWGAKAKEWYCSVRDFFSGGPDSIPQIPNELCNECSFV